MADNFMTGDAGINSHSQFVTGNIRVRMAAPRRKTILISTSRAPGFAAFDGMGCEEGGMVLGGKSFGV